MIELHVNQKIQDKTHVKAILRIGFEIPKGCMAIRFSFGTFDFEEIWDFDKQLTIYQVKIYSTKTDDEIKEFVDELVEKGWSLQ